MDEVREKVLLMGRSYAGKTSMWSIIFANYVPRDTETLGATVQVEHSQVRFLGDITLNIWDCGGQDGFMEKYLAGSEAARASPPPPPSSATTAVFDDVQVLIYVFDVESRDDGKDAAYFARTCAALRAKSPEARVFLLLHKMDLVPEAQRATVYNSLAARMVTVSESLRTTCFATSIWNESLYEAWSAIVCSFVPNCDALQRSLTEFCDACDADEVVLFERATFLAIASARGERTGAQRQRRRRRRFAAQGASDDADEAKALSSWSSSADARCNGGNAPAGASSAAASSTATDGTSAYSAPEQRPQRDGQHEHEHARLDEDDDGDDDDDDDDTAADEENTLDVHRFEKVSNIVKQFKLSCLKSSTLFQSLEMHSDDLVAVLDGFTGYTYAMVIATAPPSCGYDDDEDEAEGEEEEEHHDREQAEEEGSHDNGTGVRDANGAAATVAPGGGVNAATLRLSLRGARPHFAKLLAIKTAARA